LDLSFLEIPWKLDYLIAIQRKSRFMMPAQGFWQSQAKQRDSTTNADNAQFGVLCEQRFQFLWAASKRSINAQTIAWGAGISETVFIQAFWMVLSYPTVGTPRMTQLMIGTTTDGKFFYRNL